MTSIQGIKATGIAKQVKHLRKNINEEKMYACAGMFGGTMSALGGTTAITYGDGMLGSAGVISGLGIFLLCLKKYVKIIDDLMFQKLKNMENSQEYRDIVERAKKIYK